MPSACKSETPCGAERLTPAGETGWRKRRILFVDDDGASLHALERNLFSLRLDWELVFAANALRARELLAKRVYDAVVISMQTPGETLELVNEVAVRSPESTAFIRCNPKEKELLTNDLSQPTPSFPKEWDGETLVANVQRTFRLKVWTASESMKKLIAQMERLPSLPALYTQVMAEMAKEEASTQFVGRLIAKDPGMTAKMLQMVNSTVFSLPSQILDPAEAVLYLGAERTKSVLLLASLSLQFDKHPCQGFSHEQLWLHSMTVAAAGQAVALGQMKERKLGELAYTAGLLHDVGKLLLAANVPQIYAKVLEEARQRSIPQTQVELEMLGASHAELGAAVLGTWGLPVSILEAIAWHHSPDKSDDQAFSVLTSVHAANAVEEEKRLHKSGQFVSQIDSNYMARLGLGDRCNRWRESCGLKAVPA